MNLEPAAIFRSQPGTGSAPRRIDSSSRNKGARDLVSLPEISPLLLRWFLWYVPAYLKRNFHAVHLSRRSSPPSGCGPFVFYLNHAAWWDPLVCAFLAKRYYANVLCFAPIDTEALKKYAMFRRLGFFGVPQRSPRGWSVFVRTAKSILSAPGRALWMTPQGRFADVRERPVRFRKGLGHLAASVEAVQFVPMAIEYGFRTERQPEIFVKFGDPIAAGSTPLSGDQWSAFFEHRMAEVQDALALQCQSGERADFQTILKGTSGASLFYDTWRRLRAWVNGERFSREHQPHSPI